jgi:hypothetical protein
MDKGDRVGEKEIEFQSKKKKEERFTRESEKKIKDPHFLERGSDRFLQIERQRVNRRRLGAITSTNRSEQK